MADNLTPTKFVFTGYTQLDDSPSLVSGIRLHRIKDDGSVDSAPYLFDAKKFRAGVIDSDGPGLYGSLRIAAYGGNTTCVL